MKTPQMCSGRRYGPTDIRHDLFRSGHDLAPRIFFPNDLLRSSYNLFDASRQEKHDACKMNVVPLLNQRLLQKNVFDKTAILSVSSLEAKPSTLGQI